MCQTATGTCLIQKFVSLITLFIPGHTSCTAQQLHIIILKFFCKTKNYIKTSTCANAPIINNQSLSFSKAHQYNQLFPCFQHHCLTILREDKMLQSMQYLMVLLTLQNCFVKIRSKSRYIVRTLGQVLRNTLVSYSPCMHIYVQRDHYT